MLSMIEILIVGTIVAGAALYVARVYWRMFTGVVQGRSSCGPEKKRRPATQLNQLTIEGRQVS